LKIFHLNSFADLVSLSSNSIEFHNFRNKVKGKYSIVLKITCSSLNDFAPFGSAEELNISWKEDGRFLKKYLCMDTNDNLPSYFQNMFKSLANRIEQNHLN